MKNVLIKIFNFFKKIFITEKVKEIESEENYVDENINENDFLKELKEKVIQNNSNSKVHTLVCYGDGLGIK